MIFRIFLREGNHRAFELSDRQALMTTEITPVELMKLLADDTRLTSIVAIMAGPRCVCDLMELLNLSQPKVSRHLAILREANLVETERRGQWVYYSLAAHLPEWAFDVLHNLKSALVAANPKLLESEGEQSSC